MTFKKLFNSSKPIIGMIHTGTTDGYSMLELAQREIEMYLRYGISPLIENFFGSAEDCEAVLKWMRQVHPDAVYGLNILGNYKKAFALAAKYGARFIQIDSVCGHLEPKADAKYAAELAQCRADVDVVLLGGVRFKYQPIRSGRSLQGDLLLGIERCDAIVCTGEGTGMPTSMGKVDAFREVLGDFPIIVGAGVTLDSLTETLHKADGAIVGSWLKFDHNANNPVNEELVKQFRQKM